MADDRSARRIGWRRFGMALTAFALISPAILPDGSPRAEIVVIALFLIGMAFSAALSIRAEKREPQTAVPGTVEALRAQPSSALPNL